MNSTLDNKEFEDDQEWLDGFNDHVNEDINNAVRIEDPISTMVLPKQTIIDLGTNLKHVIELMQSQNQNCVLTLFDDKLGGILTERDILLKVTGKGYDLDLTIIDEFITNDPDTVTIDDPLAYALNKMHIGGFRNVPVVDDNLYPIGIIGISDIIGKIADYFHSEIINLPPLDKAIDTKTQEGG